MLLIFLTKEIFESSMVANLVRSFLMFKSELSLMSGANSMKYINELRWYLSTVRLALQNPASISA